jgi:hypothetical protein
MHQTAISVLIRRFKCNFMQKRLAKLWFSSKDSQNYSKKCKALKRRINFNQLIKGPILIESIDTIDHALHKWY